MPIAGLIVGALAGMALGHNLDALVAGALIGGFIGLVVRAFRQRNVAPGAAPSTDAPRIALLERRIERLEAALARLGPLPESAPAPVATPQPAPAPDAVTREPGAAPPPMPAYGARTSVAVVDVPQPVAPAPAAAAPEWPLDAHIRRWLTEGNLPARVGVVVLLFGVAFLLRYFTEHFTVPIEARLAAVAAAGVALIAFGARVTRTRPAYGVSLQGLGCGVLYLTTFSAFRLYAVLPASVAIAMLVAVAALTVWRAVRNDSQPLAALAIAGGFLAPVLVGGGGTPLPLFAWFAILNATVVALAWRHSWRALNVVGFVFTFVLGLAWGYRFYRPEYFAVVEPFLVLFFAFYVAIAVLYAKQHPLVMTAPVDGLLVFGVPLVGFALQFALVHDMRYGAAWSALALAVVYGVLFAALRRHDDGRALLARAFGALAVIFVTVAIPNALEARWTSAWWALEAAGVYWIDCRQSQPLARAFALVLQLAAAMLFLANRGAAAPLTPFANAAFAGSAMIALGAGATAWLAEREPTLRAGERVLAPIALAWAVAWWLLGGIQELQRGHGAAELPVRALAWCAATALVAMALRRPLQWSRLAWAAATLLPMLVLATLAAWLRERTTLLHAGWLVWPLGFALHWVLLRLADRADDGAVLRPLRRDAVHAVSALVLLGWLAWEASEWTGRRTEPHTVWIACAAVWPAIVALWLSVLPPVAARWPVAQHAHGYQRQAGAIVACALLAWIGIVDVLSPGDPAPLAYLPLLNPLDLTLIAALGALARWSARAMTLADRDRYGALAVAGFIALNGAVLRAAHHLGGIAWSLDDLLASRPLQAALTLTWTVTALALMLFATRRGLRAWWSVGAALLAIAIAKLFLVDLATLSGLPRVVAFLGVGGLLLVIGYVAPFPPARETPQAKGA